MYLFGVFLLLVGTHVCFIDANFGSSEGNDYAYGTQASTDTLIASETITKSKSLLGTTTKTYTLTQAGTAKTITYIKITDLKKMRGATAEITSGGVGATTVTIKFTSARGAGIKSQVVIYGS